MLMSVRHWELWEGENGSTFFPANNEKARTMARVEGAQQQRCHEGAP
jgi:hypothetical protein